jgi:hypothetical protein
MRPTSAFLACAFLLAASAASAESRVFIIANQADGYGVDQCLAQGENAARMPPGPIANHGNSPRPRLTGVSTRTKSRDRFPSPPAAPASMTAAINTSPLPASAETSCRSENQGFSCHTGAPETT